MMLTVGDIDRQLLGKTCQRIEATDRQGAEESESDRAPMTLDANGNSSTEQQCSTIDEIESFGHDDEAIDFIDTSRNLIPSNVAMTNKIYNGNDSSHEVSTLSTSIGESAQAIAASRIFASSAEEDDAANRDCSTQNYNNDDDDDNDSDKEDFEMLPNLANLVAASLRDRVVLEQMEEIKLLKKQLKASRKVEVTGKDGMPVYARGDFTKGQFNWDVHSCGHGLDEAMGGIFWDVGLKMKRKDDDEMSSTPLQNLKHIEIWIGGVLYCTSEEIEGVDIALGIRPGNCFDHKRVYDMKRSVVCEFNPLDDSLLGRNAFLTFHMTGFPRDSWRSLQSVAMLNRSNALLHQRLEEEREERREARQRERLEAGFPLIDDNEWFDSDDEEEDDESEPFDVYSYIANSLSRRHPEQRANFTSVSFCVKSVRSKIKQLKRNCEVFEDERNRAFELLDDIRAEEAAAAIIA